VVSNFGGEGVSGYTLVQLQKRLCQQFSRAKISNYAEVSNFGGEGVSGYTLVQLQKRLHQHFSRAKISNYAKVSNFEREGITLHNCAVINTLTSAIFKVKEYKNIRLHAGAILHRQHFRHHFALFTGAILRRQHFSP